VVPDLRKWCFFCLCADKIQYHQCGVPDTEKADILGAGTSSFRFIEDALTSNDSACVLVHCASGVSRSVALVIHYLMRKQGSSCHEALLHIRAVHPAAQPNQGFLSQLEALELTLAGRDGAIRSKSCVGEAQPFERIGQLACRPAIGHPVVTYDVRRRHGHQRDVRTRDPQCRTNVTPMH
jgi:hypothetical protein